MNEIDRIKSLITGLQRTQPRIYEAFSAITKALDKLDINLDAVKSEIESIPGEGLPIAPNVLVFYRELTRRNIILRWEQPDSSIFYYIVKKGGTDWDTASHLVTTATLSAVFDALPVGITRYWIKGMDFDGNVSEEALPLDVYIPEIGSFAVNASVIDNNVLLSWGIPISTWEIDYYNVYRDDSLIGKQDGTFAAVFEATSGYFLYKIVAVDWAGNLSLEAVVNVQVRQPPDFDLVAQGYDDLSGTKVNAIVIDGKLLTVIIDNETWAEHFEIEGWLTIQDQIDAGFPIYSQPGPQEGAVVYYGDYAKVFDFGAVFNNVIINLSWNQNPIIGDVNVSSWITTSADGVNWSAQVSSRNLFVASMRYVHVEMWFVPAQRGALIEFFNLIVSLNVKSEIDSGQVMALASDVGGTVVVFNKLFKDINSITVTVDSNEPLYAIYDFVDVPNPTFFRVLVYDSSGNRRDYSVSWKIRGIT